MVLQVLNAGGSTLTTARRYGGVAVQGRSTCGGAGVSKAFSAAEVRPGGTSTTIEVSNLTNPGTDIQQLFVEDVLPAPLVWPPRQPPLVRTHPGRGSAGDNTPTLSGASSTAPMLPAAGCSITAEVVWPATAQCNMAATNTIRPGTAANGGQFSTALGVDPTPASAESSSVHRPQHGGGRSAYPISLGARLVVIGRRRSAVDTAADVGPRPLTAPTPAATRFWRKLRDTGVAQLCASTASVKRVEAHSASGRERTVHLGQASNLPCIMRTWPDPG